MRDPEWGPNSLAVVREVPEDGSMDPVEAEGHVLSYLLGVEAAEDAMEVWSAWRGGRQPTPEELCEAVVFYALHDAYLPTEEMEEAVRRERL